MVTVELTYHGPPIRVIELDRTLENGDTVEVEEALAGRLLAAAGFDGPDRLKPAPFPDSGGVHGPQNAHPEGLYPDDEGFAAPEAGKEEPSAAPDFDEDLSISEAPKKGKG